MKLDRDFAKELCAQLGIEWDSQASVPTLEGTPLTEEDFKALFSPAMSISSSADIYTDSDHILNCA